MQPFDPQNDIKGTGNCELWDRQADLIAPPTVQETTHDIEQYDTPSQPPQAEDWLTKVTLPTFQTLREVCMAQMVNAPAPSFLIDSTLYKMH